MRLGPVKAVTTLVHFFLCNKTMFCQPVSMATHTVQLQRREGGRKGGRRRRWREGGRRGCEGGERGREEGEGVREGKGMKERTREKWIPVCTYSP